MSLDRDQLSRPGRRNPYRDGWGHHVDIDVDAGRDPLELDAPGLRALDIDHLVRRAYAEGHRAGAESTVEPHREGCARAFDEGYAAAIDILAAEVDRLDRLVVADVDRLRADLERQLEKPKSTIAAERKRIDYWIGRLVAIADGIRGRA